jgi:hypothetical protein
LPFFQLESKHPFYPTFTYAWEHIGYLFIKDLVIWLKLEQRVIMFDIAAFEPDAALVKNSSSGLLHATDHPRKSFRRQHSALMSWPEHFYGQNQDK